MWKPIAELKRDGEFPVEVWHPEGVQGWQPYPRGGWSTFISRAPSEEDVWFRFWLEMDGAWFRVVAPPPPSPAADER